MVTAEHPSTRDRLVAAALAVFSREGTAATTKEIARAAGVNEVTLFRHFATKDQLLTAVVGEVVRAESEALDHVDFEHFDLLRDLTRVASVFHRTMDRYQGFSLTMLAQPIHRDLAEKVVREVVQPVRNKFIAYLAEGQRRGLVRKVELAPAVDAFTGMIFAGVLRGSIHRPGYSQRVYLETCVSLFLTGISMPQCK
ncbi:MAG: transcriptional regulator [Bryobacterales bacterium]|nr:transcriptional regulator [Bryobacterales bacterium]